jgi:hypothetical protein
MECPFLDILGSVQVAVIDSAAAIALPFTIPTSKVVAFCATIAIYSITIGSLATQNNCSKIS